jgi:hypothetical protein
LTLAFLVVGARWIWVYRRGQPLDIDEAGYIGMALVDYQALVGHGLAGWASVVFGPGMQAPLTSASSSLVFYLFGPHLVAGFAVPLVAAACCIPATYALGKTLGSPRIGLAASVLVASCPLIVNYSRSFHFSMPATALFTVTLLALARSNRFERVGWAALFGVALGSLPLARTMTIAFVPGIVAGAVVYAVVLPAARGRRLLVLAASLVLAALTAATWLGTNGAVVLQYLTSFGYGARSAEYGTAASRFGLDAWHETLLAFVREVFLPHALLIAAGAVAMVVVAWREARATSASAFFMRAMRSPLLPLLVAVTEAFLALTSSPNKGGAFFAPIVPAMLVATVWAFSRLRGQLDLRSWPVVVFALVAILATAPSLDVRSPLAVMWGVRMPLLGGVPVADARGTIQAYESFHGYGAAHAEEPHPLEPVSPAEGRAWIDLEATTAETIAQSKGPNAGMALGFRHYLYNVNTVRLTQLVKGPSAAPVYQIEPALTGESVEGYASWLATTGASACALLTSDGTHGALGPAINPVYMLEAAERGGFMAIQRWPTPDGQTITLWQHKVSPPSCGPTNDTMPHVLLADVQGHLIQVPETGFVDLVTRKGKEIDIVGWAADRALKTPALAVHVFLNGTDVLAVAPDVPRPDVNEFVHAAPEHSFGFHVLVASAAGDAEMKVFAQMHDGAFAELPLTNRP